MLISFVDIVSVGFVHTCFFVIAYGTNDFIVLVYNDFFHMTVLCVQCEIPAAVVFPFGN